MNAAARPASDAGPPAAAQAAGWHGKLPTLGDFASRRLQPAFVAVWDAWLAAGLLALRERDPAGWLQAYLDSPSWRFLLLPGALPAEAGDAGQQAWAGVLMPSVDRVGRYFPFTALWPLQQVPAGAAAMQALWRRLAQLDELAGDALQDDWPIDRLEAELQQLGGPALAAATATPPPEAAAPPPAGALVRQPLPAGADVAGFIDTQAHRLWQQHGAGRALWWASPQAGPPQLWVSHGLPRPEAMAALLASTT